MPNSVANAARHQPLFASMLKFGASEELFAGEPFEGGTVKEGAQQCKGNRGNQCPGCLVKNSFSPSPGNCQDSKYFREPQRYQHAVRRAMARPPSLGRRMRH